MAYKSISIDFLKALVHQGDIQDSTAQKECLERQTYHEMIKKSVNRLGLRNQKYMYISMTVALLVFVCIQGAGYLM